MKLSFKYENWLYNFEGKNFPDIDGRPMFR